MSQGRIPRPPRAIRRFTVLPTALGFEIIDSDGRPVDVQPTRREAREGAKTLNRAAEAGDRTLSRALVALSDPRFPPIPERLKRADV